jgi:hypothetical protein
MTKFSAAPRGSPRLRAKKEDLIVVDDGGHAILCS